MEDNWNANTKAIKNRISGSLPDNLRIKIISVGCLGVGKSCLIKRYCEDRVLKAFYMLKLIMIPVCKQICEHHRGGLRCKAGHC